MKGTCNALNVRKDQIDAYCLREIKNHILNEEAMRSISLQIANAAGNATDEMQEKRDKAARRKEKILGILKKIKRDVYEEEITEEEGDALAKEYREELADLENTLFSLKTALEGSITPEGVYDYLQELLTLHGSENDELQKMLFDKLIDKILVHDDKIEVHLIVFPFARIGDKVPFGQPKYEQSLMTTRKELKRFA